MTVDTMIGKITASEKTLNIISCMAHDAEITARINGYAMVERKAGDVCHKLYRALKEAGYYDDLTER